MNWTSPLLSRPGAAPAPPSEELVDAVGVAWHYGRPLAEQRDWQAGTALVDRSQRTVLEVAGPDAAVFLNNLLSQKLDDAPAGFSAQALDLDGQGHVLHAADVTHHGDAFYLDLPADQADTLREFLQRMVFWSDVTIATTELAVLSGGPLWDPATVPDALFTRDYGWRRDAIVPRAALASLTTPLVGLMAYTAERVRAGVPEVRADLDQKTIAHEVPQWIGRGSHVGAVHLHKGCYRGQETVARVENLGRAPRLLVVLQLDGSAPARPAAGTPILLGARTVGRLGTVIDDVDYGPVALGLVKRSALQSPELRVDVEGVSVSVAVDPDSLPAQENEGAGRAAVNRLLGR